MRACFLLNPFLEQRLTMEINRKTSSFFNKSKFKYQLVLIPSIALHPSANKNLNSIYTSFPHFPDLGSTRDDSIHLQFQLSM